MFIKTILVSVLLVFYFDTYSQKQAGGDISIVDVPQLMSIINKTDDTLRVFNFWATWCKPCVAELPYFEELNRNRKTDKFHLYLVSLDFKKDYKKRLLPFMKRKGIESSVILFDGGNPNNWIDQINPEWSGAIPASLIAYKGRSCFEENSFVSLNALNSFIDQCKINLKI